MSIVAVAPSGSRQRIGGFLSRLRRAPNTSMSPSEAAVATKIGEMAAVEPYLEASDLAKVPGTSHFLSQEKPHLVNQLVLDFLTTDCGCDQARPAAELNASLPTTLPCYELGTSSARLRRRDDHVD